jgi:nucleotide-binding universal stress UspA family protein
MTIHMRRILVAIGDLQHAPKNELRKAATLAKTSGASVELFHAIMEADPGRSYPETATAKSVAQHLILTNTDWELIRQCPVPVLLVKSRRP